MSFRYAIFALVFGYSGAAIASELGELAASMAPGTFAELDTGLSGDFLYTEGAAQSMFAFADSANWDPISNRFSFLGSPHGAHDKLIIYDEATNSWQSGPVPCGTDCFPHAWDHNAMNPATGDAYFRIFGSRDVYELPAGAAQWTKLPSIPSTVLDGIHCCGGLEFFPELGGLVYADGWGVALFEKSSSEWTRLHGDFGLQYQSFVEYNPVHHLMLLGGGNGPNDLFKLDAAGQLTQLGAPPIPLGITQSLVTVDPVTGLYLVYDNEDQLYQYDISTDVWGKLEVPVPSFRQDADGYVHVVEAAIPAHGVVMFVTSHNGSPSTDGAKVYLYKHAPCGSCDPGGGSGGSTSGGSNGSASGGSSGTTSGGSGGPGSEQGGASGASAGGAPAQAGNVGRGAGGAIRTPSAAPAASASPGTDPGCGCRHTATAVPRLPGLAPWVFSLAMAAGMARRREAKRVKRQPSRRPYLTIAR